MADKKHSGGQGTFGGVDLLERSRTSDQEEKREPLNLRNPDLLEGALTNALGRKPGGHVTNKMFVTPHEFSRDTDITYDRFYYELNLLVHYYSGTKQNYAESEETRKEVEEMRTYAHEHGYGFLPIIGGEVTPDQLAAALKAA
jgi:hypothetical protein